MTTSAFKLQGRCKATTNGVSPKRSSLLNRLQMMPAPFMSHDRNMLADTQTDITIANL